jgi:SAM-dependent methyltransferase
MPPGLPRRENLPITPTNVREWFPSPRMENALAGEPWWQVQSLGLLCALRLLHLVPPGEAQQQALWELRRCLDTALLAVPEPTQDEIDRRMRQTLAPWAPSPPPVVDAILKLAEIRSGDRLLDLGSGDGRIVIAAAEHGIAARGVEIDAKLVQIACDAAALNPFPPGGSAEFFVHDIHEVDLSWPTIVTCYLLTSSMEALAAKFRTLRRGTRIVSHAFAMAGWEPARTTVVDTVPIYCWVV